MIKIQLSQDGMAFSIADGECKAMGKHYADIASSLSRQFKVLIDAGKIDLHADVDLQLAESLMDSFPEMTIDTSKHQPLPRDTWDGGRVF